MQNMFSWTLPLLRLNMKDSMSFKHDMNIEMLL